MRTHKLPAMIVTVVVLTAGLTPQAHAQEWIRQLGTSAMDWAWGLAPDGAGGVFVAGLTYGSLGGQSAGQDDAFLARYDSGGNQLWIRQFGTSDQDYASGLALYGAGGVMVAGYTEGDLGGPNAGSMDVFLARYDSGGNQLWITQFGTSDWDDTSALAPDGAGGVMVAGETWGNLGGPNAGEGDAFLARYDSGGNQLWITQFGTHEWERAWGLAPDGAGGVMVAGETWGSLVGPNAGEGDAILARYDSGGNQLWITQFGTNGWDDAWAVATDGAGSVMVAGQTMGSLGGPNAGAEDAYLARFTVAITTDSLPVTALGASSSFQFVAVLGTPPYSWSVSAGSLPAGTSLSSDGVLSGTPTEAGDFMFSVTVTDSANNEMEKEFTLTVFVTAPPPQIRARKTGTIPVPGRIVDYFIFVQNVGGWTAEDIIVWEFIEPWFTFISSEPVPTTLITGITEITDLIGGFPAFIKVVEPWFAILNSQQIPTVISGTEIVPENALILEWKQSTLAPGDFRIFSYQLKLTDSMPP